MRITPLAIYLLDVSNTDDFFKIVISENSITHSNKIVH